MREAGPARLRRQQQRRQRLQAGKQPRQTGIVEVMQEQVGGHRVEPLVPGGGDPLEYVGRYRLHVPAELAEIIAQPVRDEVEAIEQHEIDRGPVSRHSARHRQHEPSVAGADLENPERRGADMLAHAARS